MTPNTLYDRALPIILIALAAQIYNRALPVILIALGLLVAQIVRTPADVTPDVRDEEIPPATPQMDGGTMPLPMVGDYCAHGHTECDPVRHVCYPVCDWP